MTQDLDELIKLISHVREMSEFVNNCEDLKNKTLTYSTIRDEIVELNKKIDDLKKEVWILEQRLNSVWTGEDNKWSVRDGSC